MSVKFQGLGIHDCRCSVFFHSFLVHESLKSDCFLKDFYLEELDVSKWFKSKAVLHSGTLT